MRAAARRSQCPPRCIEISQLFVVLLFLPTFLPTVKCLGLATLSQQLCAATLGLYGVNRAHISGSRRRREAPCGGRGGRADVTAPPQFQANARNGTRAIGVMGPDNWSNGTRRLDYARFMPDELLFNCSTPPVAVIRRREASILLERNDVGRSEPPKAAVPFGGSEQPSLFLRADQVAEECLFRLAVSADQATHHTYSPITI